MKAVTFGAQYELIEFNHYIDQESEETVNVLDIVIKSNTMDCIENEFNNLFVIDTEKTNYVFSNYELIEYYEVGGGLIRIICIK